MSPTPTVPARERDRGSAAIEAAVGTPAFLLFVALILLAGRLTVMQQVVQAAAADAARAASLSRTPADADTAARAAAQLGLDSRQITCSSVLVQIDTTGFTVPVGTPASVSATVTCRVDLTGIDLPGLGARDVAATMISPLDTYRARS